MADHRNFYFLISSVYCQMPPKTRINLIKNPTKQDRTVIWRKKYRIARIEVDCDRFLDRMSRNQSCHSSTLIKYTKIHVVG